MKVTNLKKILIVAADSSKAHFYLAHGPKHLRSLLQIDHLGSRLKNSELTSKEHDVNTCPYEDPQVKKNYEKNYFAKEIEFLIEKFLTAEGANEVCIFAPPKFLGEINLTHHHALSKKAKITEVAKDVVRAEPEFIHKLILDAGLSFMVD